MTDYVLVHGGMATGWYWGEVAALLEQEGHRVEVPELPSTGTDPASLGDLQADVVAVRKVLDDRAGPVVLVGHSYGGVVITELANDPRVSRSVYVAALRPQPGQSAMDLLGEPPAWLVPRDDGAVGATDDLEAVRHALCADVDPQRAAEMHRRMVLSSVSSLVSPSTGPSRTHPTTYIITEHDNLVPPAAQEAMATFADDVVRLASSHQPMLSMPGELAAVLGRIS